MRNRAALLVNLGSPESPDVPALRKYLNQFLMDPYVIQLPWLLRRLIVSLFVLPRRPRASAEAYRSIWMNEGSPLIVLSRRLLDAVRARASVPVSLAMRYGKPSIESRLLELAAMDGVDEILLVPLYPHFADSTVTTSVAEARRVIRKHGLDLTLRVKAPFYEDPAYIEALVTSARPWLDRPAGRDHLVFSYHGLPESHITAADPTGEHCLKRDNCCSIPSPAHATCYRHQVLRTTECFAEKAGLEAEDYSVAFQSRLGRARWLEPSTENTLASLARDGRRRVEVICPAFVTDCLETLEEIEIQGDRTFREAGGESLSLIPCLNDHPDWAALLARWCEEDGGQAVDAGDAETR